MGEELYLSFISSVPLQNGSQGLSPEIKVPGREADPSSPFIA
jgi:hypothetical protein